MRTLSSRALLCATVALACAYPAALSAQEDTGDETFLSSTSTTTTSSAVVTGLGVLTVVLVTPKPRSSALQQYLQRNPVAVREALHMGAGVALDDLSQAFAVAPEHRGAFGALLRARRAELLAPYDDGVVTAEETGDFIRVVHAAMRADATLAATARSLEG